MKKLLEMLSVARPGNSDSVSKWTIKYIDAIAEKGKFWKDEKGNRYLKNGENPYSHSQPIRTLFTHKKVTWLYGMRAILQQFTRITLSWGRMMELGVIFFWR